MGDLHQVRLGVRHLLVSAALRSLRTRASSRSRPLRTSNHPHVQLGFLRLRPPAAATRASVAAVLQCGGPYGAPRWPHGGRRLLGEATVHECQAGDSDSVPRVRTAQNEEANATGLEEGVEGGAGASADVPSKGCCSAVQEQLRARVDADAQFDKEEVAIKERLKAVDHIAQNYQAFNTYESFTSFTPGSTLKGSSRRHTV